MLFVCNSLSARCCKLQNFAISTSLAFFSDLHFYNIFGLSCELSSAIFIRFLSNLLRHNHKNIKNEITMSFWGGNGLKKIDVDFPVKLAPFFAFF